MVMERQELEASNAELERDISVIKFVRTLCIVALVLVVLRTLGAF